MCCLPCSRKRAPYDSDSITCLRSKSAACRLKSKPRACPPALYSARPFVYLPVLTAQQDLPRAPILSQHREFLALGYPKTSFHAHKLFLSVHRCALSMSLSFCRAFLLCSWLAFLQASHSSGVLMTRLWSNMANLLTDEETGA